jgi:hypothetical protein
MLVNRNDKRAWESYYTLQANKTKQGDATYEENDEFPTLPPSDQMIVRNQMHPLTVTGHGPTLLYQSVMKCARLMLQDA